MQGLRLALNRFALQDRAQMLADGLSRHGPQIELQTTRKHGDGNFLRIGGGQDEFQILGGLLQCLEHGVERRAREHVHLIDHEHFEASLHGLVDRLLQELLHLVHAPVGRGIEFGVVDKPPCIDGQAHLARTTRLGGNAFFAIERLGQNP